tara:strand:- start:1068 stop:1262 length:195 start_codon:yes stop_codon:yes gene_type:complete
LRCKTRSLDEAEMASIAELRSMDDVLPRPTVEAQKELLERIRSLGNETPDEVAKEFSNGNKKPW